VDGKKAAAPTLWVESGAQRVLPSTAALCGRQNAIQDSVIVLPRACYRCKDQQVRWCPIEASRRKNNPLAGTSASRS